MKSTGTKSVKDYYSILCSVLYFNMHIQNKSVKYFVRTWTQCLLKPGVIFFMVHWIALNMHLPELLLTAVIETKGSWYFASLVGY